MVVPDCCHLKCSERHSRRWATIVLALWLFAKESGSFVLKGPTRESLLGFHLIGDLYSSDQLHASSTDNQHDELLSFYQYRGITFSYRSYHHRTSINDTDNLPRPILVFIHPIGIGLASWFWQRLLMELETNRNSFSALYAINLWGCGQSEGSATFNNTLSTNEDDTTLTTWVEQCEYFVRQIALSSHEEMETSQRSFFPSLLRDRWSLRQVNDSTTRSVVLVSQGAVAPLAVVLAARLQLHVSGVIMISPPEDLTMQVPARELRLNYNFLSSRPLGSWLFANVLETEAAVRFFSNLFLFAKGHCDEEWVDCALREANALVREPICRFNAGYCQYRSFQNELRILPPTLILQGNQDQRNRSNYQNWVEQCTFVTLPGGKNLLPWEAPTETAVAICSFLERINKET